MIYPRLLTNAEICRRWRERHPRHAAEYQKKYRQVNPERTKTARKIQYDKHEKGRNMTFRGKTVSLDNNPRKGICSKCGHVGKTDMHHDQYDINNPLAYTRELCRRCHTETDGRFGNDRRNHKIGEFASSRKRDSFGRFI